MHSESWYQLIGYNFLFSEEWVEDDRLPFKDIDKSSLLTFANDVVDGQMVKAEDESIVSYYLKYTKTIEEIRNLLLPILQEKYSAITLLLSQLILSHGEDNHALIISLAHAATFINDAINETSHDGVSIDKMATQASLVNTSLKKVQRFLTDE